MSRCIPLVTPDALEYQSPAAAPMTTPTATSRAEVASAFASVLAHILWIACLCWRAAGR